MMRVRVFAMLLGGIAGCSSALDVGERDASFESSLCDAVMPAITPWTGQPLPPLYTNITALYLCFDQQLGPPRSLGILVDGDKIPARYEIAPEQMGAFAQMVLSFPAQWTGDVNGDGENTVVLPVIKGCPGSGPRQFAPDPRAPAFGAPGPENAAYLIYRTHLLHDADLTAYKDFASGSVCPKSAAR